MTIADESLRLLARWFKYAERFWYSLPDRPAMGCFGTGYNTWGVQTNQKYVAAAALLAAQDQSIEGVDRQFALDRALAALRFCLASHVSGDYRCTDGAQWGNTWISALGIERMMHGVHLIEPLLAEEDQAALRRVLVSEADWLLTDYRRSHPGIQADPWAASGKNDPESNIWNGAILWRAAVMYPDHPRAADWTERALTFLINGVSVATDAANACLVDGKPVKDRFIGANFHPDYALDHHGYLNVGYMVICVSNAAMLHFDLRLKKLPTPEAIHHHQADLWQVLRRMIFADGRLARIGGDSRVRYAYCQEYLLPALLYAADQLGDPHALALAGRQLQLINQEAEYNGDGSFYSRRLAPLLESNIYYYTRLEGDRANALSMAAAYAPMLRPIAPAEEDFEDSAGGGWMDSSHGAAIHRSRSRFASFAWRAHGLTEGHCQPPGEGHLAEWADNLGGSVRFMGDDGVIKGGNTDKRRLIGYTIDRFDGGFATCGSIVEGMNIELPEGWRSGELATSQQAFIALPDGHTVVGFQYCRLHEVRAYASEIKGMKLNLPNDLYNGFQRRLLTAQGERVLRSPAEGDETIHLASRWANLDGRIGAVGLFGAQTLSVHRSSQRRGGKLHSLFVDELCFKCEVGRQALNPGQVVMDVGWLVMSDVSARQTMDLCDPGRAAVLPLDAPDLRAVQVTALDDRRYVVAANFGASDHRLPLRGARELVTGQHLDARAGQFTIHPGEARVFLLD
jgi:hypothetical protein